MLLAVANLKGGSGKTTWAVEVAGHFNFPLLDLDPQGDASIWAQSADHPCAAPHLTHAAPAIVESAEAKTWTVADCPPAESKLTTHALEHADAILVPVRGGPQDLQGWGRLKTQLDELKRRHRKTRVGIVANGMRNVGTLDDVLGVLRAEHKPAAGVYYLGQVGLRQAVTLAYLAGTTVSAGSGPAAEEFSRVLTRIRRDLLV